ncbi:MAG: hypothetical protein AAGF11_17420 [Myxococcota bacterium]
MRAWLTLVPALALLCPPGCQRLPGEEDDDDGSSPPSTTDGGTFLPGDDEQDDMDGDSGTPEPACDPVTQTGCSSGQKCTAIGMGAMITYTCVSDPGGLGPEQTCDPSPDGIDGCPAAYACLADEANNGLCTPLCENDVDCAQGQCIPSREEEIPYCADNCSPFESSCPAPLACRRNDDRFSCQFLGEGDVGVAGEFCNTQDDSGCAPGLVCVAGALVPECTTDNCCTPLCDLTEDEPCTTPTTCVPLLTGPAPGFDDIGACFVPS